MKKMYLAFTTVMVAFITMGCGGDEVEQATEAAKEAVKYVGSGPGWLGTLVLIIIPIFVILVKLFRESEATSDSLISLEGQLRRLNNKIDDMEASIKGEKD